MSLEITEREREAIRVLDLKGRLVAGEEAGILREHVKTMAAGTSPSNAILNLAHLDYIDSTGLGALTICYTTLKKGGGSLKLLHLNRRNIELLVLTKLSTVFEVFNDEQDAVNSFFPDRELKRFDILDFVQNRQRSG